MESDHKSKTVVLVSNLGTPNQPTEQDVRVYLREFLSDKDVIRLPRIFWLPLLHLIILRVRPKKSAELYKKVWTEWGSPLLYNTFLQAGLLRQKLHQDFVVDVAMRYGKPSIESKIIEYIKLGFNNILFLPMFPQYSTTTTKSIANQIARVTKKNKIFGSCWGLQVLVTAAGGKIRKNPKGLEAVVAKEITLNEMGEKHPMYVGKNKIFDAFCWHYDDTENLPPDSKFLASNEKSEVQSIDFTINNSE